MGPISPLILLLAAIWFLAALALLIRGWRGKRIDDHPLCRACGFDLSGNSDAKSCPECGAAL